MALKTAITALAIGLQTSGAGTFDAPSSSDIYPISQCGLDIQGVTVSNDEYLGTIIRNSDDVIGKRATLTFRTKIRPPSSLPSANAFIPGRLMQAAKYTEIVTSTAIPASAEAVGGSGNTTTNAALGTSAAATADLYKGFPLLLSDNGATAKEQLTAIRSYDASKNAELMEELSAAPAANYQIPTFLGYMRSTSNTEPPLLSTKLWIDGFRFDLLDCRCTGARYVVPTTTRQQAAYPEMEWTFDVRIHATADETTPTITPLGTVPFFRDGDMLLDRVAVGSQTFTIDNGVQTEDPPNPNQAEGVDAAEMVSGTASVSFTWQMYRKSEFDAIGKADAQAQHPMFAQWGPAAGPIVQLVVPDFRFNYPSPDLGGNIAMQGGDLLIDAFDRSVCLNFVFLS